MQIILIPNLPVESLKQDRNSDHKYHLQLFLKTHATTFIVDLAIIY